ncbi:MAG: hypothetical protein WCT24_02540 [Patescibacteria group bacterium]
MQTKTLLRAKEIVWYRLLRVLYFVCILVPTVFILLFTWRDVGFIFWGYYPLTAIPRIVGVLLGAQLIRRILYYIYFGKFFPEIAEKKWVGFWDLALVGLLLITDLIIWLAWSPPIYE